MQHNLTIAILCLLAGAVGAAQPPATRPVFIARDNEFIFDTGPFRGTLRAKGRSLGLTPVVDKVSQTAIAGTYGLFSPYRMLDATNRYGTAAWDWAARAKLNEDGSVEVRWTSDPEHPFDMLAVYCWSASDTLDLTVQVSPRRDLRNFELFLASYLPPCDISLVHAGSAERANGFLTAGKADGDWQMFPRDDNAIAIIGDGRWVRPPHPVNWTIRPKLAGNIAIRRSTGTGLTAVVMAPPDDCFAIATPYGEEGHRSVYLCLFGRNLAGGVPASARSRLILGKDISNERALALYRQFIAR